MRYLLNIIYVTLIIALSPWLLYSAVRHGKYRDGLAEKLFGLVPSPVETSKRAWFHAVSVGEVNLLGPILERFENGNADTEVVISSTTNSGYELACRKYPNHTVFYCPLDFSWAVRTALRRIKPDLLVLVELELWPNLLMTAGDQGIPIAIINGRLSDRSTRGYSRLGWLMRKWMSNITAVAAQSQTCAARFVALGVEQENVHLIGSAKFDGARQNRDNPLTNELSNLAKITRNDVVFVAGSTQAPEEAMAVEIYQRLATDFPQLKLIVVPRHPERGDRVADLLDQSGVIWTRRTEIDAGVPVESTSRVLLVDTVGELGGWWGCAHIGFVGGSMGKRGGQNMLEPSGFGVATCFGPNTKNFRDVVDMLLRMRAATVVHNKEELYRFVRKCITDEGFRNELGQRAQRLVISQRGAADATVQLLGNLLSTGSVCFQSKADFPHDHSTALPRPCDTENQARRRA